MRNAPVDIPERMLKTPFVPVLVVNRPDDAALLAMALERAGLTALEVTFRTRFAAAAIADMKRACPDVYVGAGTLTRPDQIEAALDAGSDFLVTPGATERLYAALASTLVPVFPGVATASEALRALEHGYPLQKFFPAETNGGIQALKALHGPLPQISFMPTGGIHRANMADYLALPNVNAIGGSWMIDSAAVAAGDWETVTRHAVAQTRSAQ